MAGARNSGNRPEAGTGWELSIMDLIVHFFPAGERVLFFFFYIYFLFKFYFIFKLYKIVLVLPNIKMNPPQVYMCSPS